MRAGGRLGVRPGVEQSGLLLALTGFTTLMELDVVGPDRVRAAIDPPPDRLLA